MNETRVVHVTLAAHRRVEWNGRLRVPSSFTDEQVREAANDVMDPLAGDEFQTDYDYWEAVPPYVHESEEESHSRTDIVDFIVENDFTIRRPS